MPATRPLALSLLILLALPASVSQSASAQVSCADDPECDRLANEARDHSKAGRYDAAQRAYEQAFERRADPTLMFNLARVLHKAGRPAAAATYYQAFLKAHPDVSPEERRKTEQYLKQAKAESAAARSTPVPTPAGQPAAATPATPGQAPVLSADATPAQPREQVPLYRKWWLWTIVGTAVGVTVIGLAAGLAPRRPDVTGLPEARPFGD